MLRSRFIRAATALILCVALLSSVLLGLCSCSDEQSRALSDEINILYAYRNALETELADTDDRLGEWYDLPKGANISLVYTEPLAELIDAYEVLRLASAEANGSDGSMLHATVCFTEELLPGDVGCITLAELSELLAYGVDTAVYYDGRFGDAEGAHGLSALLAWMRARLAERGLEMPCALFLAPGCYTESVRADIDAVAAEYGIRCIMRYEEIDNDGLIDCGSDDEMLRPGIVNWQNTLLQKAFVRDVVGKNGCAVYAFSLSEKSDADIYLDVDSDSGVVYRRMIDFIISAIIDNGLSSSPADEAKSRLDVRLGMKSRMDAAVAAETERIQREINRVNGLIGRTSAVTDLSSADKSLLYDVYSACLERVSGELNDRIHVAYMQIGAEECATAGIFFETADEKTYGLVKRVLTGSSENTDGDGKGETGLTCRVTIGISAAALPGDDGFMSVEQLRELMSLGCDLAVSYGGEPDDVTDYLTVLGERLCELGMELPRLMVLDSGCVVTDQLRLVTSKFGICGIADGSTDGKVYDDGSFICRVMDWSDTDAVRFALSVAVGNDEALLLRVGTADSSSSAFIDGADVESVGALMMVASHMRYYERTGSVSTYSVVEHGRLVLALRETIAENEVGVESIGNVERLAAMAEKYRSLLTELDRR